MRVIGGSARGRTLRAPLSNEVRPTSDRVREAVFDVLTSLGAVEDARFADLFAGSGALGIEALSRGAAEVVFVESNRRVAETITANLVSTGLSARARVVVADALSWSASSPATFDVALCDPPYAFTGWPELLSNLRARLVVAESSAPVELPEHLELHRIYRYGTTLVTVAQQAVDEDDEVLE